MTAGSPPDSEMTHTPELTIARLLDSGNPITIKRASSALKLIGKPAISSLMGALRKGDDYLRSNVIDVITDINAGASNLIQTEWSDLKNNKDPALKAAYIELLGRLGDREFTSILRDALNDTNHIVRSRAEHALRILSDTDIKTSRVKTKTYNQKILQSTLLLITAYFIVITASFYTASLWTTNGLELHAKDMATKAIFYSTSITTFIGVFGLFNIKQLDTR